MIRLRYPATCSNCEVPIAAGELAEYDRITRTATCGPCAAVIEIEELDRMEVEDAADALAALPVAGPAIAPPAPTSSAGASAQAMHDELRAQREARARQSFGRVGGAISRWSGDSPREAAWSKGAVGERRTAERLERRLSDTGVLLLHDRLLPRSRANVDHLAIGPGGVTVIDAKHLKGKVRSEVRGGLLRPRTEHLLVGGRDRTTLIDGLRRQTTVIAELVPGVSVEGCLCLVDAQGLPVLGTPRVDGLPVLLARGAAKLAARPGPLSPTDVAELHEQLAFALAPAR